MSEPSPRYVTCRCQHCDEGIEFDANQLDEGEASVTQCPHCGLETRIFAPHRQPPLLMEEPPPIPPAGQRFQQPSISKLRPCPDCKQTVSINAESCPHCGAKLKKRRGVFYYVFFGVLSLLATGLILSLSGIIFSGVFSGIGEAQRADTKDVKIEPGWTWKVMKLSDADAIQISYRIRNDSPQKLVHLKLNVTLYDANGEECLNKTYTEVSGDALDFIAPNEVRERDKLVYLRLGQAKLVQQVGLRLVGFDSEKITSVERRLAELAKRRDTLYDQLPDKPTPGEEAKAAAIEKELDAVEAEIAVLLKQKR